ncbi:hypothetical protein EV179_004670 [Coemansia sp. RSA 487]|nr:hypothetical protein EV179_004670 [Coemansia sp. RSA 487]
MSLTRSSQRNAFISCTQRPIAYRSQPLGVNTAFTHAQLRSARSLSSMKPELKQQHPYRSTKIYTDDSMTTLHRHIADLSKQAEELAGQDWCDQNVNKAVEVLAACEKIVASDHHLSKLTDDQMIRVFEAADRFGRKLASHSDTHTPALLPTRYLDFYARLARPDIVQRTFSKAQAFKGQPSASSYSAQQLALLKFTVEKAAATTNRSYYLRKMALRGKDPKNLADLIESRLVFRSVEDIARDAMHRYRILWMAFKALEYAAFISLVWILGKWLLVEKVRFLATTNISDKIMMVAVVVVFLPLILYIVLRYSTMGILTAPPPIDSLSPNRSRKDMLRGWLHNSTGPKIPLENDLRAREILRVAFPAAPAENTTAELHKLLWSSNPSQSPCISWQLRLALGWARLARRFAVVDPMFVGEHGLNQRLALMWTRNLAQMIPPDYQHSPATMEAISGEIHKFISFVKRKFEHTPFALAADDLQTISAFVATNADSTATKGFLELVTGGFVGLRPGGSKGTVSKNLDYHINFALEPISKEGYSRQISGFERSRPLDIQKHVESAVIMSFAVVISQLSWKHTHPQAIPSLNVALRLLLDTRNMPISAVLYRSAFSAAAEVLHDPETARLLAASFEQRYLDGDQYIVHIVQRARAPKPIGWKLPSAIPAEKDVQNNPLVDCISPYVAHLAHTTIDSKNSSTKTDHVADFVERWNKAEILDYASCVQCLHTAICSVSTKKTEARLAEITEQWVLAGFKIANTALGKASVSLASKESVLRALYQFLEQVLKITTAIQAKRCGMCVYNKWKDMMARHLAIPTHATATFNSLLIKVLSSHPQSQEHVMRALEILDLIHGLGQMPELQALDALCAAASHANVDISHQIEYWTHNIKSKAKDTKMNEFVKSLF